MKRTDPYDLLAPIYDRYWGGWAVEEGWILFQRLFLPQVPSGSRVLELGCGTGRLTARLAEVGLRMVGLDRSLPMLLQARRRRPDLPWIQADVRQVPLRGGFDAVLWAFDGPTHLDPPGLEAAFREVARLLRPGGLLFFDLSTEPAFRRRWQGTLDLKGEGWACHLTYRYDPRRRLGITEGTFRMAGKAHPIRLEQRCPSLPDLLDRLRGQGLEGIRVVELTSLPGLEGEAGRVAVWAVRGPEGSVPPLRV